MTISIIIVVLRTQRYSSQEPRAFVKSIFSYYRGGLVQQFGNIGFDLVRSSLRCEPL